MSSKRESLRLRIKLEHDEQSDNDSVAPTPKHQRKLKERNTSKTGTMSLDAESINVSESVLQAYKQMLPKHVDGIAFLFGSDFSEALQTPAERAAILFQVFTVDEDATKISPTPLMDEIWHAAILDNKFYADLQEGLGLVLHHRPSGTSHGESEPRKKRQAMMEAMYSIFFSAVPLRKNPQQPNHAPQIHSVQVSAPLGGGEISIVVRTLTGKSIPIFIIKEATIGEVKNVVEYKEGIPPCLQDLIFNGTVLEDNKYLGDYDIGHGALIHLMTKLRGC